MLDRLKKLPLPYGLAIIGLGAMGQGLLYQTQLTPGFRCVAVADINLAKAQAFLAGLGQPYRIVTRRAEAEACVAAGILACCEDARLLCDLTGVNTVIEASSAIAAAGEYAERALQAGKHLVMMNAECDLIFGPWLQHLARQAGVVYTSCDGDQHGVLKRLLDQLQLWGFTPVMAGNIKGFLDRRVNPATIVPEADKRRLDYRMCTAYTDGTKLNIEMALLANGLGYNCVQPGMIGPRATQVQQALTLFDLPALRRLDRPVVDYLLGAEPGGGVFAIGYCEHPYQRQMMTYYKMGDGPFYLFYRPYHLCHVEAMQGIAEAILDGQALLAPWRGFQTQVIAYAKTALKRGTHLDGVGGYTCYGLIENLTPPTTGDGLPICLAEDCVLTRDLAVDERLTWDAVSFTDGRRDLLMYHRAVAASAGTLTP